MGKSKKKATSSTSVTLVPSASWTSAAIIGHGGAGDAVAGYRGEGGREAHGRASQGLGLGLQD